MSSSSKESIDDIVTTLQKLSISRKGAIKAISDLREMLYTGENLYLGSTLDAAKFIHSHTQNDKAYWDTSLRSDSNINNLSGSWGQFRVFPSGGYSEQPIYFGYKIDRDEFVWGRSWGRDYQHNKSNTADRYAPADFFVVPDKIDIAECTPFVLH